MLQDIIGADLFDGVYNYFWSSSEHSDYYYARGWHVDSYGDVDCGWNRKYYGRVVRPVLAF